MTNDATTIEGRFLGAVLQENGALATADISTDDFSDERHRHIWRAIAELVEDGKPANIATISLLILERGDSGRFGGLDYVTSLTSDVLPQCAAEYARAVRDVANRRRLRASAELLISRASDSQATNDDILRAIDNLESVKDSLSASRTSIRTIADVPSIFELDPQPITFLVDGLIQQGAVTMLAGEPGVGKSYLAHRLAVDVALGGAFLGLDCRRCDVLILDAENPLGLVQTRLEQMTGGPIPRLAVWGGWNSDPPPQIGDPRLLKIAKEAKPLFIFDTFLRFHGADENSASEIRPVMAHLRRLADAGASVLLIHHKGKSESKYRGSSDILAGVDCGLALEKADDGLLSLHRHKSRFGSDHRFTIRPDFIAGTFELTDSPVTTNRRDCTEEIASVIEQNPGLNTRAILAQVKDIGTPKDEVLRILRDGTGVVWRVEDGPRRSRIYYPISDCSSVPEQFQNTASECSSVPGPYRTGTQNTRGTVERMH